MRQYDYCCCLFGFNVAFNNFSVISRRCLVATRSSMLTVIVLPHWRIMPQALNMIPHSVPSEEQVVPFLTTLLFAARDWTHDLPFPEADTLPYVKPEQTTTTAWATGAGDNAINGKIRTVYVSMIRSQCCVTRAVWINHWNIKALSDRRAMR